MKRRYKLLIGFLVSSIILVTIFFITRDKKIYYLSLGDSIAAGQTNDKKIGKGYPVYVSNYLEDKKLLKYYTNDFSNINYRSIDILNDIKNNKKIEKNGYKITLKNALIKADVVTLSVGFNDLFYKINIGNSFELGDNNLITYIDECFHDINNLLNELRKNCKEQIIVLGFYNPFVNYDRFLADNIEPAIIYMNKKMKYLTKKYDMTFLDMHNLFSFNQELLPDNYEIHPKEKGYRVIADKIVSLIDNKKLAK